MRCIRYAACTGDMRNANKDLTKRILRERKNLEVLSISDKIILKHILMKYSVRCELDSSGS
jgi:hypothetical protein